MAYKDTSHIRGILSKGLIVALHPYEAEASVFAHPVDQPGQGCFPILGKTWAGAFSCL